MIQRPWRIRSPCLGAVIAFGVISTRNHVKKNPTPVGNSCSQMAASSQYVQKNLVIYLHFAFKLPQKQCTIFKDQQFLWLSRRPRQLSTFSGEVLLIQYWSKLNLQKATANSWASLNALCAIGAYLMQKYRVKTPKSKSKPVRWGLEPSCDKHRPSGSITWPSGGQSLDTNLGCVPKSKYETTWICKWINQPALLHKVVNLMGLRMSGVSIEFIYCALKQAWKAKYEWLSSTWYV